MSNACKQTIVPDMNKYMEQKGLTFCMIFSFFFPETTPHKHCSPGIFFLFSYFTHFFHTLYNLLESLSV